MSDNTQGFWASVKKSFAYGLGGSLGWHTGNLLASFVGWVLRKAWILILVAPLQFALLTGNDHKKPPEKPPVIQKKTAAHGAQATETKPDTSEKATEKKDGDRLTLFGRPVF